jgi:GH25 family lysozyme M1 (1,4-beta-N-acetylmuramidase)
MTNAKGIDISKWQTSTPSLIGRSFVIARATWQTSKDIRFDMHAKNVLAKGKVLGAYHFGTGDATAAAQAKAFLAAVGKKPSFLVLDLERNAHGTTMSKARAAAFIKQVKALDPYKRKVGLYASSGNWPGNLGQDFNWVAHWGVDQPTRKWVLHQYRGSPLDLDQFNGTVSEMRAYFKFPSDIQATPDPEPEPLPTPPTYSQDELEAAVAAAQATAKAEAEALRTKIDAAILNLNEALADLA